MPQIIQTTVYLFNELSAKAQAGAIRWGRESLQDDEWWLPIYEDAAEIGGEIKGFNIGRSKEIDFHFTLDAISAALRIRENHGVSTETYKLAVDFISKHDEYHGVNGKITLCIKEEDDLGDLNFNKLENEWLNIESDFTKAIGECYYQMLDNQLDYINTDAYIQEFIETNEYTFTENGKRFG